MHKSALDILILILLGVGKVSSGEFAQLLKTTSGQT
jgi:hypothetical protein